MYRYTFDSGRLDSSEEYFSDDDPTVKINGLTGEMFWKSPYLVIDTIEKHKKMPNVM